MTARDIMVNVLLLGVLANAVLFITVPSSQTSSFACFKVIYEATGNDFEQFFPTEKYVGNCSALFIQPPNLQSVTAQTDFLDLVLTILFSIPGFVGYIINLIIIAIYLVGTFLITGWINVYNIIFGGTTAALNAFFIVAILLTGISLFGLIDFLLDIVQKLRGQ